MEMDTDPLEGSSYDLGVTVKAEIKEEDEDDHYNTIRKVSRVSWHQLEILCDFFKTNRAIAIAHNRALQDKEYSQRKWKEIAETLNSQSDGAYKDWTSWKKYWVDYKAKLKKRITALRASHLGTGGGPPTEKSLTEMEEKFLRILGKDFGQGTASARVEPPSEIVAAALHEGVQDSQAPEPVPRNIQPVLDPPFSTTILPAQPILEPLPQSPLELVVHDLPARSPSRTPPSSPLPATSTPAGSPDPAPAGSPRPAPADSSRRRGRRRESSMSQAAARRALVRSSQMHADAAMRTAEAMEKTVLILGEFQKTAMRIERALLELAQCVQTNQEPIEFNSTDAMMDPKTGLMICLHCLEDFDSSLLSDHMIHSHNYRRVLFKCHICQNTFQERKLLMIHRQECQPEQKVRKRKTFQQIMREVEAKYFMEDQEDLLEPAACPICLLELPKYCLKEHLLNEHRKPDVILTCGRCNRNFKSKLTLREHVKLVHEAIEDSEECELCGQKFRSLKYLSNHKRNVHPSGNKIHKCAVCGKEFKSRLCLHQHSKYVHPPESASVECPHCPNKMFKSRINLTQHLKVAHGWKRK